MKIFMLRHAHSVGNELKIIDSIDSRFDLGLSEKGKEQAKELILKLKKYKFEVFIVSPLNRTIETLNPYLKTLSKPQIIVNKLTLERDAGVFSGKDKDAIKEYCLKNKITDRVSFKLKDGESILDVYERAKKFLKFLKGKYKDESILICGHKNFLTCLEILITGQDVMDYYSVKELENGEIREFSV